MYSFTCVHSIVPVPCSKWLSLFPLLLLKISWQFAQVPFWGRHYILLKFQFVLYPVLHCPDYCGVLVSLQCLLYFNSNEILKYGFKSLETFVLISKSYKLYSFLFLFFPFHLMERAIMLQAVSSFALVPAARIGTQHPAQPSKTGSWSEGIGTSSDPTLVNVWVFSCYKGHGICLTWWNDGCCKRERQLYFSAMQGAVESRDWSDTKNCIQSCILSKARTLKDSQSRCFTNSDFPL